MTTKLVRLSVSFDDDGHVEDVLEDELQRDKSVLVPFYKCAECEHPYREQDVVYEIRHK